MPLVPVEEEEEETRGEEEEEDEGAAVDPEEDEIGRAVEDGMFGPVDDDEVVGREDVELTDEDDVDLDEEENELIEVLDELEEERLVAPVEDDELLLGQLTSVQMMDRLTGGGMLPHILGVDKTRTI